MSNLLLKWRFDSKSDLSAPPAVVDLDKDGREEIIFGTKDGQVIALDASAVVKWVFGVKESLDLKESLFLDQEILFCVHGTPTVADIDGDGRLEVVFGTEGGFVYVLSDQGKLKWKFSAGSAIRASILTYDLLKNGKQVLVFGAMDGFLYVVDAQGRLLWRFNAESGIEAMPTVFEEKGLVIFFFGCDDGSLFAVSDEGKLLWRFKTGDKILAQPVIGPLYQGSNFIVVGSMDHSLYAVNLKGAAYWRFRTAGAIVSKAVLVDLDGDGCLEVVFGSCDNTVYALSSEGDKLWSFETDFWIVSPPLVLDVNNDGRLEVVVGSYDHKLYVLDGQGSYSLDFLPGLAGVVAQNGGYTDLLTRQSGKVIGKKLNEVLVDGMVVGCGWSSEDKSLVVNTKLGKVDDVEMRK